MMEHNSLPDFLNKQWLSNQIFEILHFYYPSSIDHHGGGYYNFLGNDGTVLDPDTRSLVVNARFVYCFSIGSILAGPEWCKSSAEQGLRYLVDHHLDEYNGGYFWELKGGWKSDTTKHAYGHSFVLLAFAIAYRAGIKWAYKYIYDMFQLLENRFWDPEHQLYADEMNENWTEISSYRGQNANMHLCEAMIASYESTGDRLFLNRAVQLAQSVVCKLTEKTDGLLWEHYHANWQIDWKYNIDDPKNLYRSYGFMPGHFVEWSKLLVILERYQKESWMIERAEQLFKAAMREGWDNRYGGMYYTLGSEGKPLDRDKYGWVMAEGIGASACLAVRTNQDFYWGCYEKLWSYIWEYFIDKKHGNWYRTLSRTNYALPTGESDYKKDGYHQIGACFESLRALDLLNLNKG